MSLHAGGNACNGYKLPVLCHEQTVPDYNVTSFMQLGSGQFIFPEQVLQSSDPALSVEQLGIQNLVAPHQEKINSVSDKSPEPTQALTSHSGTDVWAYLASVAPAFRSDLKELLLTDRRGREFLYSYCTLKKIDSSLVSSILIESELKDDPDRRIPRSLFLDWAHDLALLLPISEGDLWYRAYNQCSDGRQSAGGILYQKYNNKRKTYRKIGLLKSEGKRNRPENQRAANRSTTQIDDVKWLENNDEPRNDVINKWMVTQPWRFDQIDTLGIQGYFEKFKPLQRSDGYVLLDMDFDTMYPGCKDSLFSKWNEIAKGLIYVAKQSTSPEVLNFLHTHRTLIDNDKIEVLAFLLLPRLLGSIRIRSLAGHQRPSRIEILNSFILHIETLEDLQPQLEVRARCLEASKQTSQPFPLLIGPIDDLVSSRVLINNVEYNLCSPIKAIDSCFKSFFALNAKYQKETFHCWLFIEQHVYGINRKCKKYACVNKLICSLNAYFASRE